MTPLEQFQIDVPDADLVDLRRRLSAARWPSRETVSDWSQGLPLNVLRELCEHWQTAYDWRLPNAASTDCLTIEQSSTDCPCISFTCDHRSPKPFR